MYVCVRVRDWVYVVMLFVSLLVFRVHNCTGLLPWLSSIMCWC